jgi:hypothetical protein
MFLFLALTCVLFENWQFEVVQPSFQVVSVSQPEEKKQEPSGGDYVIMYTATWCGYCQNWKNGPEHQKLKDAGITVYFLDIDEKPSRKVNAQKLPTFYIVDGKTHIPRLKTKRVGGVSARNIKQMMGKEPVPVPAQPQAGFYNPSLYNGRNDGNSHASRESLIRHLFNDGIHRGRYPMSQLTASSDNELNALHERDHKW